MATITNTKLAQGQINGSVPGNPDAKDLGAEIAAIESAVKKAVGGADFTSNPAIDLAEVGAMINKGDSGKMEMLVDIVGSNKDAAGFAMVGGTTVTATTTLGSGGSLSVAGTSTLTGNVTAVAGVSVGGALGVTGVSSLGVVNTSGNVSIGAQGAGKDLTVWGDLVVKGATVTVESSTLTVKDSTIVAGLADGPVIESALDGAGLFLGSEGSDLYVKYVHADAKWEMSKGVMADDFRAGNVLLGSTGVVSDAALKLSADASVDFLASGMTAQLPLNGETVAAGVSDYAGVFGLNQWAHGLSLIGALGKEHSLRVDAIATEHQAMLDAVAAEAALARGYESGLRTDLNTEISRATTAEGNLQTAINAEVTRAQQAEGVLQGNITAEAQARSAEDSSIRIDFALADSAKLIEAKSYADGQVLIEKNRAMGVEGDLQAAITAEAQARSAEDSSIRIDFALADAAKLQVAKDYADAQVLIEKNRAEGAESTLDGKITTEKNRAMLAESNLQTAISTEVTNRIADVDAEESRALQAEGVLQGNITAEAQARSAEDTAIRGVITALDNAIKNQSKRLFSQTLLNAVTKQQGMTWGPGVSVNGWFLDASKKEYRQVDVHVNGQLMQHGSDYSYAPAELLEGGPNPAAGQLQFGFSLSSGDLIVVREH